MLKVSFVAEDQASVPSNLFGCLTPPYTRGLLTSSSVRTSSAAFARTFH
ncbi:hypothetical protein ACOMHN_044845 [Nucella lapillus]